MLSIKVLGSGCANCKRLEQTAQRAVDSLGVAAQVEKVTDYSQIMGYGVMATPGLVIDEKVMSSGRLPSLDEVTGWLAAASE